LPRQKIGVVISLLFTQGEKVKEQTKLGIILFTIIMAPTVLLADTASPSLNAKCNVGIVQPINASSVFFDESCSIAYVMPPINGKAEINSLAGTTNLQFCPSVKKVNTVVARIISSIEQTSEKMETMIKDFDPLNKEILNLRTALVQSKINMEAATARLGLAESKRQEIKQALTQARKLYEDCIDTYSSDNNLCKEASEEWTVLKTEAKIVNREYRDLNDQSLTATEEYNRTNARMREATNRHKEAVLPMFDLLERLSELNSKVMNLYKEYAQLEGAKGQISWSIKWDKLLDEYRRLNPNLTMHWTKMPIKEAELVATAKLAGSNVSELTSLVTAHIPGAKRSGIAGIAKGQKVTNVQIYPSIDEGASIIFSNSIAGQIVLNLLGACPYFDGIHDRTSIDPSELANHMIANLAYSYELAARRGYNASYNLSNLLSRIEEKTKTGGLFSTSHAHVLIESQESNDWFKIDFSNNTADFQYTVDEQVQITKTVKAELFDKALKQFAILNAGTPIAPPIPQYIESGASKSAQELRSCHHYYCQAGSAIFRNHGFYLGK
jgi:hypothetical protein